MEHNQRAENLSKYIFSPKHSPTPPTKDKSISRQMVLKDAGAACLRWEASDGSKQLSSRMLVWVIPPCRTQRDTHIRVSPESLGPISDARCHKDAAYSRFAGKRGKKTTLREGEGRVNISYSCYQTESYISIPLEFPQVMLKRLRGSQAPEFLCSYRNVGGSECE